MIPKSINLQNGLVEGFDKKEWLKDLKNLKKDVTLEDRDRFRPLLCVKRDLADFLLECEKIEKKDLITLCKE